MGVSMVEIGDYNMPKDLEHAINLLCDAVKNNGLKSASVYVSDHGAEQVHLFSWEPDCEDIESHLVKPNAGKWMEFVYVGGDADGND
jgi:hypothetical protein